MGKDADSFTRLSLCNLSPNPTTTSSVLGATTANSRNNPSLLTINGRVSPCVQQPSAASSAAAAAQFQVSTPTYSGVTGTCYPESCKRVFAEDFQNERPLWKLTCYGHWKSLPCDISGDISCEELRASAYDDAKRGLVLPSIVEMERNLLNSKQLEFESLLRDYRNSGHGTSKSLHAGPGSGPPTVSSFSQLGASLNLDVGLSPATPQMPSTQPNPFSITN